MKGKNFHRGKNPTNLNVTICPTSEGGQIQLSIEVIVLATKELTAIKNDL